MDKGEIENVTKILEQLREYRDLSSYENNRFLYNNICDNLDILLSKLILNEE